MSADEFWTHFKNIYGGLPRQGPGLRESTEQALGLIPPLTADQRLLDIGCGTGAQTLDLARATEARIVAVDNHPPFVAQLARRAAEQGLSARITAQVADMTALPFPDGAFDVLWCEGAIFIMGFAKGLTAWRRLLKPGGYVVVSEFCWMQDDPPAEVREIFLDDDAEADVGDVAARREAVAASGYRLLADFVLPAAGWRSSYYAPLGARLAEFRREHAGDPEALAVADRCQHEIDVYQKHPDAFGYVFFVMQTADG